MNDFPNQSTASSMWCDHCKCFVTGAVDEGKCSMCGGRLLKPPTAENLTDEEKEQLIAAMQRQKPTCEFHPPPTFIDPSTVELRRDLVRTAFNLCVGVKGEEIRKSAADFLRAMFAHYAPKE